VQKQVLIYHRWGNDEYGRLERFIIVVNFSKNDQVVDVPFPTNDAWTDILNPGLSVTPSQGWVHNWTVNSNWGNVFFLRS
jgi:Alpha amylase, C-terminal all-beta domain